ncbi:MAG: XRE family transcriptional regulator [Bacteroidales bacterium]|nr:MAG: XRE family transcriptional regulator [Bacteroidales bacterium]
MDNTLGDRIEKIKKDTRYKIDDFVSILGVSKQAYNGWINNTYYPSSDILIKILEHFPQYRAEWLLLGKGEMKKNSYLSDNINEPLPIYSNRNIIRGEIKDILKKMVDNIDDL